MSWLVLWTVPGKHRRRIVVMAPVAVTCMFYGFIIEVLQPVLWPANRTFSWVDIAANVAGVLASVAAWNVMGRGMKTMNGASDGIRTRDSQNHNLAL